MQTRSRHLLLWLALLAMWASGFGAAIAQLLR